MLTRTDTGRLLVVKPRPDVAALLPHVEMWGWAVERCSDLRSALTGLAEDSYAAVLLDRQALETPDSGKESMAATWPNRPVLLSAESWAPQAAGRSALPGNVSCSPETVRHARTFSEGGAAVNSLALKVKELREQVERQRNHLRWRQEVSERWQEVVFRSEELYSDIAGFFARVSQASRVALMLRQSDDIGTLDCVASAGSAGGEPPETPQRGEVAAAVDAVRRGEAILNCADSFGEDGDSGDGCRILALPLRVDGRMPGAVVLSGREGSQSFQSPDIEPLQGLAETAAVYVQISRQAEDNCKLAFVDELTGLYNRRYLRHALERETERAQRTGQGLALAVADIDHFKNYNDAHGHPTGDRALRRVSEILRDNVRDADMVCRYGGEEFVIILPESGYRAEMDRETAVDVLQRIRRAVMDESFDGEEQQPGGKLTISAGVAMFGQDGSSPATLLQAADRMLYEAKKAGRNCVKSLYAGSSNTPDTCV